MYEYIDKQLSPLFGGVHLCLPCSFMLVWVGYHGNVVVYDIGKLYHWLPLEKCVYTNTL